MVIREIITGSIKYQFSEEIKFLHDLALLNLCTGDSFPVDQNSKMRTARQLREETGPCSDHIVFILQVRRPP